jgi:hypothetical protein
MGWAMDKYPLERDDLHQLFLKAKVGGVFAGDSHRYDRSKKDGILYLIYGGGGAPSLPLKREEDISIMSGSLFRKRRQRVKW